LGFSLPQSSRTDACRCLVEAKLVSDPLKSAALMIGFLASVLLDLSETFHIQKTVDAGPPAGAMPNTIDRIANPKRMTAAQMPNRASD
jgi:hypothetical protein